MIAPKISRQSEPADPEPIVEITYSPREKALQDLLDIIKGNRMDFKHWKEIADRRAEGRAAVKRVVDEIVRAKTAGKPTQAILEAALRKGIDYKDLQAEWLARQAKKPKSK